MINQLFVRMAGFFVCSGGTAACGEEGGCNTAMQRKKSHARGEAYGEGKGNLRGDKGGREKESNGEDGKGLYCWDAP